MTESLIFSAFPFDVILCKEFGPHGDIVRERLRQRLFVSLQHVLVGLKNEHFMEFDAHLQARRNEYITTWRKADTGRGLEQLGRAAAQAIYGSEIVGVIAIMACSVQAEATFDSFNGFSAKYEILA